MWVKACGNQQWMNGISIGSINVMWKMILRRLLWQWNVDVKCLSSVCVCECVWVLMFVRMAGFYKTLTSLIFYQEWIIKPCADGRAAVIRFMPFVAPSRGGLGRCTQYLDKWCSAKAHSIACRCVSVVHLCVCVCLYGHVCAWLPYTHTKI